jgi:hypothetical protein
MTESRPKTSERVLIDCAQCETKVHAEVLATKEYGPSDNSDPTKLYVMVCPVCDHPIVGWSDLIQVDHDTYEFDSPTRVWPNPEQTLHYSIPVAVRRSIEEARLCLRARAFSACAVMCGRALEALCQAHGVKKWQLAAGLKELRDKKVIDGRLYEWGDSLRERRNIGAHATGEDVSREDARDVLDFTTAICEYVYVLAERYREFKEREAKRAAKK